MVAAVIGIIVVAGVIIVALMKWEHISKGSNHNVVTTDQSVRFPGGSYSALYQPTHLKEEITFRETKTATSTTRSITWSASGSANAVSAAAQQFYAAASRGALTGSSPKPLPSKSTPRMMGRSGSSKAGSRSLPPGSASRTSPTRVTGKVIR